MHLYSWGLHKSFVRVRLELPFATPQNARWKSVPLKPPRKSFQERPPGRTPQKVSRKGFRRMPLGKTFQKGLFGKAFGKASREGLPEKPPGVLEAITQTKRSYYLHCVPNRAKVGWTPWKRQCSFPKQHAPYGSKFEMSMSDGCRCVSAFTDEDPALKRAVSPAVGERSPRGKNQSKKRTAFCCADWAPRDT